MNVKRTSKKSFFLIAAALLLFSPPAHVTFCAAAQPSVGGDLDGDGNVTLDDVGIVLEAMTSGQHDPRADINGDGKVDKEDLDIVMNAFEKSTGQKAKAN